MLVDKLALNDQLELVLAKDSAKLKLPPSKIAVNCVDKWFTFFSSLTPASRRFLDRGFHAQRGPAVAKVHVDA